MKFYHFTLTDKNFRGIIIPINNIDPCFEIITWDWIQLNSIKNISGLSQVFDINSPFEAVIQNSNNKYTFIMKEMDLETIRPKMKTILKEEVFFQRNI